MHSWALLLEFRYCNYHIVINNIMLYFFNWKPVKAVTAYTACPIRVSVWNKKRHYNIGVMVKQRAWGVPIPATMMNKIHLIIWQSGMSVKGTSTSLRRISSLRSRLFLVGHFLFCFNTFSCRLSLQQLLNANKAQHTLKHAWNYRPTFAKTD